MSEVVAVTGPVIGPGDDDGLSVAFLPEEDGEVVKFALDDDDRLPALASVKLPVGSSPTRRRAVFRCSPETYARAEYWAERKGYASVNELVGDALEAYIARINGDYDLPTLEIARLNQLVDAVVGLSANVANLQTVVQTGQDSLLGLVHGENYLLDANIDAGTEL